MKKRILVLLLLCCPFLLNGSCTATQEGKPEEKTPEEQTPGPEEQTPDVPGPVLALLAPADGTSYTLGRSGALTFAWEPMEGQIFYRLWLSLAEDLSGKVLIVLESSPATVSAEALTEALEKLGVAPGEAADLYWSIGPWAEDLKYTPQVRHIQLAGIEADPVSEPVTDPIRVKVAVVYEDPVFNDPANPDDPRNGKRIHEIEHWNDPHVQLQQYAAAFEEVSHGAVDIEIVEEHESEQMFCYTSATANSTREYMTPTLLYERYFNPDPATGKAHIDIDGKDLSYDYVAMMDAFGLSAKVDAGTINEVWVYNHPACHMNESRFMGKNGFWCNSGPIDYGVGKNYAHNKKLVCVMFCNYERTVDLALHSFGHRTESIMSQLNYNNYWGFENNTYAQYGVFTYKYDYWKKKGVTGKEEDLIPFDLFFSHGSAYEAVGAPGYAHIGSCHCPCNTDQDYIYWDKASIKTFADEWLNYPYIHSDKSKARTVTCQEWKDDSGEWQMGYMKWFYSHIPHFKGINTYDPRDLHLNNWWHYLFDYYGALEYEAELRAQIGK